MDDILNFKNKNILITGSTKGIGAETARMFSKHGANVYVHGRNETEGRKLVEEINGTFIAADFSKPEEVAFLIKEVKKTSDTLHGLINNAGFENAFPFEDFPLDVFDRMYNVNLRAAVQLTQGLFPLLRKAGQTEGASVINMSSVHDTLPYPTNLPYCMMKSALKMFSETLAAEWGPYGIRINTLSPGAILTDMNRDGIEEIGMEKFSNWIASGRVGHVSEIAYCCLFLVSKMSTYVTGSHLLADGALSKGLLPYGQTTAMENKLTLGK